MKFKYDKPRLLLIQPPVYDFALFDLFLKPYGLLRLGKWFENSGYDVHFLNGLDYQDSQTNIALGSPKRFSNGTGKFNRVSVPLPEGMESKRYPGRYGVLPDVLKNKISAADPDLIFVTTGMTYWYQGVAEVVTYAKDQCPSIPVITGGVYASLMPRHCMENSGADYVISGNTQAEVKSILSDLSLSVPRGSIPADPLMLEEVWRDAGILRINEGCPFRCDYCASELLCNRFQPGNPDSSFGILLEMYERFGTRNFAFYDDALLVNSSKGIGPFLELVLKKELNINFYLPNAVHIKLLDTETANLMRRAGFREIRLGYESSSTDFHSTHDGKLSEDGLSRAVEILFKAGFSASSITAYVLGGLPEQSWREVEESVRTAARAGIRVSLAEYSPVPETRLWKNSVELCPYPLEKEPLFHNNSFFPMEWEVFTSENLEYLKNLVRSLNKR